MSKGLKITLAVFTVWPLLYLFLFMGAMFAMVMSDFSGSGASPGPPGMMKLIFPVHFLTILEVFVLLVIYMVHVFKTDRVPEDKKALWAVVLFLGYMIAMPIYWYLYIWKQPEESTSEPENRNDSFDGLS